MVAASYSCSPTAASSNFWDCPSWHGLSFPLTALLAVSAMIYFYPEPALPDSPCFTDAVSFLGAGLGSCVTLWLTNGHGVDIASDWSVSFVFTKLLIRFAIGVAVTAPLKFVLKWFFSKYLFPSLYRVLGVRLYTSSERRKLRGYAEAEKALLGSSSPASKTGTTLAKGCVPLVDHPSRLLSYTIMSVFTSTVVPFVILTLGV
jgi:hypothetical protein